MPFSRRIKRRIDAIQCQIPWIEVTQPRGDLHDLVGLVFQCEQRHQPGALLRIVAGAFVVGLMGMIESLVALESRRLENLGKAPGAHPVERAVFHQERAVLAGTFQVEHGTLFKRETEYGVGHLIVSRLACGIFFRIPVSVSTFRQIRCIVRTGYTTLYTTLRDPFSFRP